LRLTKRGSGKLRDVESAAPAATGARTITTINVATNQPLIPVPINSLRRFPLLLLPVPPRRAPLCLPPAIW
jgi:hypothetical protein